MRQLLGRMPNGCLKKWNLIIKKRGEEDE